MNFVRLSLIFSVFVLLLSALTGCGNNQAPSTGGVAAQQKGVMGGTPPPGELEKIKAMQAEQARRQAEGQAAGAKATQSGK